MSNTRGRVLYPALILAVAAAVASGYLLRERWMPMLSRAATTSQAAELEHAAREHGGSDRKGLVLSVSARENLGLQLGTIKLQDWWRTASIPGVVTEQPGHSERRITTSLNGIVVGVHVFPGQTVRPGDPLLDIQPTGELLTTAQSSLLRTLQELELLDLELKRISPLVESGTLPAKTKIEKEYERRRLESTRMIQMQELLVRGLTVEQIANIVDTKTLLREFTIRVPVRRTAPGKNADRLDAQPRREIPPDALHAIDAAAHHDDEHVVYSVESIGVFPGKLVAPGDELCDLALHTHLNIVGHAFERESSLVGRAMKERWPLRAV